MVKKIWKFIFKFGEKASDDGVTAYAAQITFYIMLSFFPFIMLIAILASRLSFMNEAVLNYILRVIPGELQTYVSYLVDDMLGSTGHSFTIISLLVSLWSSSKGIQALAYGLDKIYGVEQRKNYFLVRIICALYTLVFLILCFVAMVLHAFGTQIGRDVIEHWPELANATLLILSMKNVFTFLVVFVFLLLIYYQLPNGKGKVRHELTGAGLAAFTWMLMTWGFSLYIKYIVQDSTMYGSLTSIILVLVWLYIGMCIVLYGAEVNYYMSGWIEGLRKQQAEKKKIKQESKQNTKQKESIAQS